MQVGDKIWVHKGRRDGWQETVIIGEAKVSWLVGYDFAPDKISKKNLAVGSLWGVKATREEVDQILWVEENGWRIGEAVKGCRNYALLIQINHLLKALDIK